jgi:hypothetical protein
MFNKKANNESEIPREQVEGMLNLVHSGDVCRERGGLFKKDGTVTEEPNTGGRFCRSMLILDTDSFDWSEINALWISNELPPKEGYYDECCGRCITAQESKIEIPRLDFVTPAQGKWADAFKVPVAVYQPIAKNEIGYFDHYDPTGATIGSNFYPQSPRAGIARKDPKVLTATAREAIKFITEREAQITTEWMELAKEYEYQENRCLAVAEQTLKELELLSVEYANGVEKIKAYTAGQTHRQPNYQKCQNVHVVASGNSYHRKVQATQAQQAAKIRNHLLSPSVDPFEFPDTQPEKIGVPIQAYSNWRR